jgi:hypothetical protein
MEFDGSVGQARSLTGAQRNAASINPSWRCSSVPQRRHSMTGRVGSGISMLQYAAPPARRTGRERPTLIS